MTTARTRTNSEAAPEHDVGAMAAQLRLSATRLARQLRRQADTGLSPSQLSALATIERRGPLTLGALADLEGVAPPSVTRVVGKLEAQGLVRRAPDSTDRRVALMTTTTRGDSLLGRSRQRKNAWLSSRITRLGPDQRARLAAALDVLDAITTQEAP